MAAPCNALRYDYCECRNDAFMRCTVCYNYYSHIVWLGRHRTIHDCQDGSTLQCIQILYVNRSIVTRMSCAALFVRTIIQMLRGSASADIGQRHNTRQWHNNRQLEALSHISILLSLMVHCRHTFQYINCANTANTEDCNFQREHGICLVPDQH